MSKKQKETPFKTGEEVEFTLRMGGEDTVREGLVKGFRHGGKEAMVLYQGRVIILFTSQLRQKL